MNYNWNWGIFFQPSPEGNGTYLYMLLSGFGWTIATALTSWILALILGFTLGVLRTMPSKLLSRGVGAYIELFRNVPLLVQMFLWYFVVPEFLPLTWSRTIKQSPDSSFYTAVICLGCYTAARVAVQVRAGILALPWGQRNAAMALGLNRFESYRFVILPQVARMMLPPLTSEFLDNVKNTSVALTIGLLELTSRARAIQEFSFQVFEPFTIATLLYLLLNLVVVSSMRALEHRVAVPGYLVER